MTSSFDNGVIRKAGATAPFRRLAALLACAATTAMAGPALAAPYPQMAPVEAYLMDRAEEIALAKSAAPESISRDATVLVLTRTGYEAAITGKNGFVCYVGRGFGGAPDWPERWNPKIHAAACDNPQAARTITPLLRLRTAQTLAGKSDAEVMDRLKTALRSGEIPTLAAGAMCYMMSRSAYLAEDGEHNMAHVMFYVPLKDGASWGANADGSPIFGGNFWYLTPGHEAEAAALPPMSVLLVPTRVWSDGTPVAAHDM